MIDRAVALIERTETELRELLAEAAKLGDYPNVVRIAAWARTLHELRRTVDKTEMTVSSTDRQSIEQSRLRIGHREGSPGAKNNKDSQYPKFFRRDNELIRLAWSKREKKEYHHKASYDVLQALTRVMIEKGSGGRLFSTDELLPIRNLTDGTEIPSYQAYVGIALLKHTGLIDQHGRRGYSIPRLTDFENAIENVWKQLPSH